MNTDDPRFEMIRRHRDGEASPEDLAELESNLRDDTDFRGAYVRYMNLDVALSAVANARPRPAAATAARHSSWLQWRPLTAAAAGLVIGLFSASMVFAYVTPRMGKVMTLLQEGFESGTTQTLPGLPRESGGWSGDEARVVAAETGLQPLRGGKMLRFASATFAGENAKLNAWSDVYRLVDLRGRVGDGKSVLRLSASFAAVPFPAGEEYACRVELCAFEDDPADAPQPLSLAWARENCAAEAKRKFPMKGDGGWQETTVEVPVSPQTRYILVHLAVQRRVPHSRAEPVQFSGHYLDDVKLDIITQPNPLP